MKLRETRTVPAKTDPVGVGVASKGFKGKLAEVKEHLPGLRSDG